MTHQLEIYGAAEFFQMSEHFVHDHFVVVYVHLQFVVVSGDTLPKILFEVFAGLHILAQALLFYHNIFFPLIYF